MSDKRGREKLFGRYHDLVILLFGFILTTLVGGFLAQSWQTRSARIAREAEQKRVEQRAATQVFEELSRIMDKRLYRMRRVHNGLGSNLSKEKMSARWEAYREVLFEWNENLNRNLALVKRYFGDDARNVLEYKIQARFIEFGRLLEGGPYPENIKSKYDHRQSVADDLNDVIYQFDIALISDIQSGNIGSFRGLKQ